MAMKDEIISIENAKCKISLQYLTDNSDRIQIYCNEKPIASLDVMDDTYIKKLFENPANVEDVVDVMENNSSEKYKNDLIQHALQKFIQWVKEGNLNNILKDEYTKNNPCSE